MRLTRRARRRLFLLSGIAVFLGIGIAGTWKFQQWRKNDLAVTASSEGLAAMDSGDWPRAMAKLRFAVARNQTDFESLFGLAEARSRVPSENGTHLRTAASYFDRAVTLAKKNKLGEEKLREALLGRAKMESAIGSIVRLESTSQALLDLDEDDESAIDFMYAIRNKRGDLLPRLNTSSLPIRDEWRLSVRSEWGTDASWLAALREAGDNSALRWSLEQLRLQPSDPSLRKKVLLILREGGMEDYQLRTHGVVIQTTLDIVKDWAAETDRESGDPTAWLVLAGEQLDRRDLEGARASAITANEIGYESGDMLLAALGVWEAILLSSANEPEGRADAARQVDELMDLCREQAKEDPMVATRLGIRLWMLGQSEAAYEILESNVVGLEDLDPSIVFIPALVGIIDGRPTAGRDLEMVDQILSGPSVPVASRGQLGMLRNLMSAAIDNDSGGIEAAMLAGAGNLGLGGNALVQILVGDLLAKRGLQESALKYWIQAAEKVNYQCVPLVQRIVRGYLDQEMLQRAFESAYRFSQATNGRSVISLLQAWISLDAAGISASRLDPRFDIWETPDDLATEIIARYDAMDLDATSLLPMKISAAAQAGRLEVAIEAIDRLLASDAAIPVKLGALAVDRAYGLGQAKRIVDNVANAKNAAEHIDQITLARAQQLRESGDSAGALALVEETFAERSEPEILNARGFARINHALSSGGDVEAELRWLIGKDVALTNSDKIRLLRIAIGNELRELADSILMQFDFDVRALTDAQGTGGSPLIVDSDVALGLALYVLAYEEDNPVAIRKAIAMADKMVAERTSSGDLELALAGLMIKGNIGSRGDAIDVLRNSVSKRPGRIRSLLNLVELLQESGRFDEADEYLVLLEQRRGTMSPETRRLLPRLIVKQGNVEEMATLYCEVAEETGLALDRLACVRARYQMGEDEEADAELDALYQLPERPVAVDIEVAGRFVRANDVDSAIGTLMMSDRFSSESERAENVGSLLYRIGRFGDLREYLAGVPTEVEGSATLQLLLATALLGSEERSVEEAVVALGLAADLGANEPGVLRRIATIWIQEEELRPRAKGILEQLEGLGESDREIMLLAVEAFEVLESDDASAQSERERIQAWMVEDDFIAEAVEITKRFPDVRSTWNLATQIIALVYEKAMTDAARFSMSDDQDLAVRACSRADGAAQELLSTISDTLVQFRNDSRLFLRLSDLHFVMGNQDDAIFNATECINRGGTNPSVGVILPLARLRVIRGDLREALRLLGPYRDNIESKPLRYPKASGLLIRVLVGEGDLDGAWRLMEKMIGPGKPLVFAREWLSFMGSAPAVFALEGVRMIAARPASPPESRAILEMSASSLCKVYRVTGDDAVRDEFKQAMSTLRAAPGTFAAELQFRMLENSLDEGNDPVMGAARYLAILNEIPLDLREKVREMGDLSNGGDQTILPMARIVLTAKNNFAAMTASAVLDGSLGLAEGMDQLKQAEQFSEDAAKLVPDSPEVMDTRASVALATGDVDTACSFAKQAVVGSPNRPGFRTTLAKALRAGNRVELARYHARQALALYRQQIVADPAGIREVQQLLSEL